jgi:hypothetical protein
MTRTGFPQTLQQIGAGVHIFSGTGAPTFNALAVGDLYFRVDGGAGSYIYRATNTTGTWADIL